MTVDRTVFRLEPERCSYESATGSPGANSCSFVEATSNLHVGGNPRPKNGPS